MAKFSPASKPIPVVVGKWVCLKAAPARGGSQVAHAALRVNPTSARSAKLPRCARSLERRFARWVIHAEAA